MNNPGFSGMVRVVGDRLALHVSCGLTSANPSSAPRAFGGDSQNWLGLARLSAHSSPDPASSHGPAARTAFSTPAARKYSIVRAL
ncbi:hypothetical protein ACFWY5_16100 [Nonomuraea sp. NPDC059007]|uniref:hypothetical protein n=1 Tax=Nonomuraea sp. NPDC059007 TaxID=3346692 RepID=UPI003691CB68